MSLHAILRSGLFWSGSAAFVLIGVAAALYGPALPALSRQYSLAPGEAGLLVAAHNAGGLAGLVASAALGAVSARQSLALVAIGAGLIAWGPGWGVTLLGGVTLGAGYALVAAVLNRRFLLESGAHGAAMVGLLNAVFGLGAIAGPLVFLALGSVPGLSFALVAGAAVLLLPALGGGPRSEGGAAGLAVRRMLRQPAILALGAAAVGFEISLVGLGPTALVARGLSEADAAQFASAFFACFLAARFSLVWLATRIAPMTLLAAAFAAGAVLALSAGALAPGVFYALAGASVGILFPTYFVAASVSLGTDERAAALILAAGYVGAVILPAAASGLIGLFGAPALFPAAAALAAASAVFALSLARRP